LLAPTDATISTEGLRGVSAYSINDLCVTVGAGTTLAELQQELARDKMWVTIASPWEASTIGGIVATNFNAPLRMRYGAIRDLILAVTAVLPDGRIIRAGRPVVKNVAGYDLAKLFVGSHGTLGLIIDVTFKIMPFPRARTSLFIPVHDLARGLALGARLLKICMVSSALLLCKDCDVPSAAAPYSIVYTVEGMPEDVAAEIKQVQAVLQAEGASGATQLDTPSGSDVWGKWLSAAAPNDTTLRMGVAPKDLIQVMGSLAPTLGDAPFMAEFATGLVYARTTHVDVVRQTARAAGGYAIVLSGPGNTNRWGHVPEGLDLMRGVKARWDPRGLFNPGAFLI
jgi:D-lactate dehydrogenase (cytochrome)